MNSFSELIRLKRQEKGYSMRTLSRLLEEEGVKASRTIINFVEKGLRPPTFELAYGLSKVLDIDIVEALRTAYLARAEHNLGREKDYLEKLIREKKIRGIGMDDVVPD
jgi:transcriptional regulator with XRE-family HTH domain